MKLLAQLCRAALDSIINSSLGFYLSYLFDVYGHLRVERDQFMLSLDYQANIPSTKSQTQILERQLRSCSNQRKMNLAQIGLVSSVLRTLETD